MDARKHLSPSVHSHVYPAPLQCLGSRHLTGPSALAAQAGQTRPDQTSSKQPPTLTTACTPWWQGYQSRCRWGRGCSWSYLRRGRAGGRVGGVNGCVAGASVAQRCRRHHSTKDLMTSAHPIQSHVAGPLPVTRVTQPAHPARLALPTQPTHQRWSRCPGGRRCSCRQWWRSSRRGRWCSHSWQWR